MADGILVNNDGTIAAVVHGFETAPPEGLRFQPLDSVAGLKAGTVAPDPVLSALAASDAALIRGLEDLVGVLVDKKIIAAADLPRGFLTKINTRRGLRGQAAL